MDVLMELAVFMDVAFFRNGVGNLHGLFAGKHFQKNRQEFEAEKERKFAEGLKRRAQEKQLAPTPKEQLPTVSLHNWLAEEKSE